MYCRQVCACFLFIGLGIGTNPSSAQFTEKQDGNGAKLLGEQNDVPSAQPCNDPWGECKRPVKLVREDEGCAVFACEHGTANEHLIRVSDATGRTQLQAWAKDKSE